MEAIKHIVNGGRLREHEVLKNVFHTHSPHRPSRLNKPIRVPHDQLLDSILSHWKEPIQPAEPTVIDMTEQEPTIVVETDPAFSIPSEPIPDEPVVIVPIAPNSDEPKEIDVIPPHVEPFPDPIEIISPEPIEIIGPELMADEEPTMPVPNPIGDISAIMKNQADRQPAKSSNTMLIELISQLSSSLGQLVGVIDEAVEKGTLSDSMVGEIDQLIPGALVDVDQISSMVGQIDKSERKR